MKTLAVILARAGSVGLANKHLRLLLGRPMIEYTFDHAFNAVLIDKVVVSTDCPGVKRLAQRYRLDVIDRPAELAGSDASVQDAMLHAMKAAESNSGFQADSLVVLYGNVPVRGRGVIDSAIQVLRETQCDSVRSFCPVGKWHPAWMSKLHGDKVEALQAGSIHRRQDLTPLWWLCRDRRCCAACGSPPTRTHFSESTAERCTRPWERQWRSIISVICTGPRQCCAIGKWICGWWDEGEMPNDECRTKKDDK